MACLSPASRRPVTFLTIQKSAESRSMMSMKQAMKEEVRNQPNR